MATKAEKARERLAEYAHGSWIGWMEHLFSSSIAHNDGTVTIPRRVVDKWKRQMDTKYENLSDKEKLSDLKEANKIIDVVDDKESKIGRRD